MEFQVTKQGEKSGNILTPQKQNKVKMQSLTLKTSYLKGK